jgi:micrococcal nuclease
LSRGALGIALAFVAAQALGPGQGWAQTSTPATVSRVIDGDTLVARLADSSEITVRLIGIDTPETVKPGTPVECGGQQASDAMKQLAEGQQVNLVSDPTQDAVDRFGRSLFYVDRTDGVDVGEEMLRAGWANVFVFAQDFQRLSRYRAARTKARDADAGAWGLCDGDFHRTRADDLRERRLAAVAFTRRYYRRISNHQFATAWGMLARPLRRKLGPFSDWRAGYRRSLGVSRPVGASTPLRGPSRGERPARGARSRRVQRTCGASAVPWSLDPRAPAGLLGDGARPVRKTSGGRVRLSESECPPPAPKPPPPPPPTDCQGYSPCLPPGPDVDCAGGSGNGPRYVNGPVRVYGSDPYGLDTDGDGVGCES